MTTHINARGRFVFSILLYGIFCYESCRHNDSVQLPPPIFFIGMSALCYLFLYLTEHASSRLEEIVGTIGAYFFLMIAAVGVLAYAFGWQHVVLRDVIRKLFT